MQTHKSWQFFNKKDERGGIGFGDYRRFTYCVTYFDFFLFWEFSIDTLHTKTEFYRGGEGGGIWSKENQTKVKL